MLWVPQTGLALANVLKKLPPVPSKVPIDITGLNTDVNEDTTVFADVAIGKAHPKRIVILGVHHGVAAVPTATVNDIPFYWRNHTGTDEFSMFAFQVPSHKKVGASDELANISITAAGSARKTVEVYVAYPADHTVIDSARVSANAATDANAADVKVVKNGFLIYHGGQHSTLGAFTTTWNGPDAVTEALDIQDETSSITGGYIASISVSADLNDLNMAETVSGNKKLLVATWGPAYGNA